MKKKILILGCLNKRSISYGISKIFFKNNAELLFTCKNEKIKQKLSIILNKININKILICDISKEKDINNLYKFIRNKWNNFDGIIYSISYTNKNQLCGNYLSKINKKVFSKTNEINVYGLISLIKKCINLLNNNASIIIITYIGSNKVVKNYNIMGPTKALLESNIKYIAYSMSELSNNYIRINGISSNPIYTTSSSAIYNFKNIFDYHKNKTIKNKVLTINDIGNTSLFLMSNLSLGINGQIIFLDYGFNIFI